LFVIDDEDDNGLPVYPGIRTIKSFLLVAVCYDTQFSFNKILQLFYQMLRAVYFCKSNHHCDYIIIQFCQWKFLFHFCTS